MLSSFARQSPGLFLSFAPLASAQLVLKCLNSRLFSNRKSCGLAHWLVLRSITERQTTQSLYK